MHSSKVGWFRELTGNSNRLPGEKNPFLLPLLSACIHLKKKYPGCDENLLIVLQTPTWASHLKARPKPVAVLQKEELQSGRFAFSLGSLSGQSSGQQC